MQEKKQEGCCVCNNVLDMGGHLGEKKGGWLLVMSFFGTTSLQK